MEGDLFDLGSFTPPKVGGLGYGRKRRGTSVMNHNTTSEEVGLPGPTRNSTLRLPGTPTKRVRHSHRENYYKSQDPRHRHRPGRIVLLRPTANVQTGGRRGEVERVVKGHEKIFTEKTNLVGHRYRQSPSVFGTD